MKRIFSILFALCLVVALSLSVYAESTNKLTYAVEASASTVSANTDFTVLVKVTENTGICWLKTVVNYDSSVLTYISATTDTGAFSNADFEDIIHRDGQVSITLGSMSVLFSQNPAIYNNTGTYASITFRVKENAAFGDTVIKVSTINGDAVKIVNSVADFDFSINSATATVKIASSEVHTCVPGTEIKESEIPATCATVGSYVSVIKCTICNKTISTKTVVVPANDDHTPADAVKENEAAGDCKTASSYDSVVYCSLCNKEISRTKVTGEMGTHVADLPVIDLTESTCTTKGKLVEIYKCKVCDTEIEKKTTELEIAAHTNAPAVKENVVNATCTTPGSYDSVIYCSVCNAKISSNKIDSPKLNHTPGKSVKENEVAATCFAGGTYDLVVSCSVCNAEISREAKSVAKLEHVRGSAVIENRKEPANCGANGSYDSVVYCTICKTELDRVSQIIKAPDHTPGPAATESTPQICTVCNTVLAAPVGHQHKWASTWTSDGVGHWHACSGCSEKKNYEDHHFANSCDEDCNICGYLRANVAHTYDNDCDESCNKCGEKRSVVGHSYDNDCDNTCNSCNALRETSHKYDNNCDADCNVCGAKRTPGDHVYGSWETVKEPTATTEGKRERLCLLCGNKITESIPATGPVTTNPPETTEAPVVTTTPPEATTEPTPGTSEPEVTTESTPGTTAPEATDPEVTTEPDVEDTGCGSAVSMGIALIAILGTALIMKKRD